MDPAGRLARSEAVRRSRSRASESWSGRVRRRILLGSLSCRPRTRRPLLLGLSGLNWPDPVRPHHLVVLVLDDVAVPDELSSVPELHADPGYLARVGDHRVLEPTLPGLGSAWRSRELDVVDMTHLVLGERDSLAVDGLER